MAKRSRLRTVLVSLVAAVAIAGVSVPLLGPYWLVHYIHGRFAGAGYPDATFEIERLWYDEIVLEDIVLDKSGDVRIARLEFPVSHILFPDAGQPSSPPGTSKTIATVTDPQITLHIREDGSIDYESLLPEPAATAPPLSLDSDDRSIALNGGVLRLRGASGLTERVEFIGGGIVGDRTDLWSAFLYLSFDEDLQQRRHPPNDAPHMQIFYHPGSNRLSGNLYSGKRARCEEWIALAETFGWNPPVSVSGTCDLSVAGGGSLDTGDLEVSGSMISADLTAGGYGLRFSNPDVKIECNIERQGGVLQADGKLDVAGGSVESVEWDMAAYGVATEMKLGYDDGALATDGDQIVRIERLYLGKLHLTDVEATIALIPDGTIPLRRLTAKWGEGTVTMKETVLDPSAKTLTLPMELSGIALGDVFALVPGKLIEGAATLDGNLTAVVRLDGSGAPLDFTRGDLAAAPPGGWFRVQKREALRQALDESDSSLAKQSFAGVAKNMLDLLVAALMDYEFEELRVHVERVGGEGVPQLFLKAKEKEKRESRVRIATLDIRLRGLADLIRYAIFRKDAEVRPKVQEELDRVFPD